jgi:hypothetical protein
MLNTFYPAEFFLQASSQYYSRPPGPTVSLGQFLMHRMFLLHPEIKVPSQANCYHDDTKIKDFLNFLHQYQTSLTIEWLKSQPALG